jgi:NAD(P)-dependent dehydrogenase (short-subunit alcohol dehydrogenase family)
VALETAQAGNITCNAICPGYVLTDLIRNQLEDTARARGIPKASTPCLSATLRTPLPHQLHLRCLATQVVGSARRIRAQVMLEGLVGLFGCCAHAAIPCRQAQDSLS